MANILITSFGNGSMNPETNEIDYRQADYFDVESGRGIANPQRLIIPAIHELFDIDKTILIGTTGSNWPLLYKEVMAKRSGFEPKSRVRDDSYMELLKGYHERSVKEEVSIAEMRGVLSRLQEELGPKYPAICLQKYGMDGDEQWYNYCELIKTVSAEVNDGDTVYFDITHSFRSLPMYALLLVKYLQQVKDISIERIPYGMFEASAHYGGKTPVVDMSQLGEMVNWVCALKEYKEQGTAYQLVSLLTPDGEGVFGSTIAQGLYDELRETPMNALRLLGDAASVDSATKFGELLSAVGRIMNNPTSMLNISENMIPFKAIFEGVIRDFGGKGEDSIAMLFAMANWHIRYHRYMQAAIVANSAIDEWLKGVVFSAENTPKQTDARKAYGYYTTILFHFSTEENQLFISDKMRSFGELFKNFKDIRNDFAHGKDVTESDMEYLKISVAYFSDLYMDESMVSERTEIEDSIRDLSDNWPVSYGK